MQFPEAHFLASCRHSKTLLSPIPQALHILNSKLKDSHDNLLDFILDPSTDPEVAAITVEFGVIPLIHLLKASRIIVWSLHSARM